MPDPTRRPAPVWTIRLVAIRSRDGPSRVAQVYRRLLTPAACKEGGPAADAASRELPPSDD